MPIVLLRNLNATRGLANGTRLIIRAFQRRVLDCEVATGAHKGSRVFIPRISMTSSDSGLPFELRRRQFPIRPAFCLTINKSQGQTLDMVGFTCPQTASLTGSCMSASVALAAPIA